MIKELAWLDNMRYCGIIIVVFLFVCLTRQDAMNTDFFVEEVPTEKKQEANRILDLEEENLKLKKKLGEVLRSLEKQQERLSSQRAFFQNPRTAVQKKLSALETENIKLKTMVVKTSKERLPDYARQTFPLAPDCSIINETYPLPSSAILVTINADPPFEMYVWGKSHQTSMIIKKNFWERVPFDFPVGSKMIDIGSNMCWWTLNWINKGFHVESFEPLRVNVNTCIHSLCINPGFIDHVKLYNVGLSDKVMTCQLTSENNNIGDTHTKCDFERETQNNYFVRDVMHTSTLDQTLNNCTENEYRFMKIDTEGHITPIFHGGNYFFEIGCVKEAFIELYKQEELLDIQTYFPISCLNYNCTKASQIIDGLTEVYFRKNSREKHLNPSAR